MVCGDSDRGVSEVIGFILIFAMLVTAFTVYQGIVVPDQNRQVEFQHNRDVQGQLQDLRNAIVTTGSTGTGQAVSVTLGATYPDRTVATNLGVSAGAISTGNTGSVGIQIDNVRALNAETRDYIDSSANGPLGPFESASIQYTPVYSFYSNAPDTIYENTVAYNRYDDANLALTDQVMIDGRRITLVSVNGSLSEAEQGTVSITTEGISTSSNRIAVQNTTGDRMKITIPTRLSVEEWESILAEEMGAGGYVYDVYDVAGGDAVTISMDSGVTYELRLAKVGVGDATTEEDARYIADVEGDDTSVTEDGTQKFVVQVRDRFNNPVSDETVTVSSPALGSVSPTTATTDSDGRVSIVYTAPADVDGAQDVDVDVSFDGDGTDYETVTFDVRVLDSDGSGGGGGGGGPSNYAVDWSISTIETEQGVESCVGNRCTYNLSIDTDSSLPLTAGTTPPLTGVFVDFSTNDSTVVTLPNPSNDATDSSGEAWIDANLATTGVAAIYASAVEDGDELVLEVTSGSGGGGGGGVLTYNGDASASTGTGTENSVVQFSVTNGHASTITITGITINASSVGTQVWETDGAQSEVAIAATSDGDAEAGDGFFSAGYDVGQRIDLTSTATIASSDTADVTLYEVRDDSGFFSTGSPVEMAGEELTVTIHYQDGGDARSRTFTVSIP